MAIDKTPGCPSCEYGRAETLLIDDSGCYVGDRPKLPGHAVDDFSWHCCHLISPLSDCLICGRPTQRCMCGAPKWCHQPEEECFEYDPNGCREYRWDGQPGRWV